MGFLERSKSARERIYRTLGYDDRSFAARTARNANDTYSTKNTTSSRPAKNTSPNQQPLEEHPVLLHTRAPDRPLDGNSKLRRPAQRNLERSCTVPRRDKDNRETIYICYPGEKEDQSIPRQPILKESQKKPRQVIGKHGTIYNPFQEDSDEEHKDDQLVAMTEGDRGLMEFIRENKLKRSATVGNGLKGSGCSDNAASAGPTVGMSRSQSHAYHRQIDKYDSEQPSLLHRRGAIKRPDNPLVQEHSVGIQQSSSLRRRNAVRKPNNLPPRPVGPCPPGWF